MTIFKRSQFLFLLLPTALVQVVASEQVRETVLDGIEHVEPVFKDVPEIAPLCHELPGLTKKYITLRDGAKIYCEEEGKGIPLVLLAGGPGNSHHGFHPYFSDMASFAQIIYLDFRGCGKSNYIKGDGYTIDQAVDDLEDVRKALGIEKWVVLGHSNGGFVAQYYAKKYSKNVLGLVLVASSFDEKVQNAQLGDNDWADDNKYKTEKEKQRLAVLRTEAFKIMGNEVVYKTNKNKFQQTLYNMQLNSDWKRQHFYLPTNDEMARIALYEYVHDWSYPGDMCTTQRTIDISSFDDSIPTLVIEGAHDLTWNPKKKPAILQSIHPHGKMVIFENSAHSPFIDEPEKFFLELKNLLTLTQCHTV